MQQSATSLRLICVVLIYFFFRYQSLHIRKTIIEYGYLTNGTTLDKSGCENDEIGKPFKEKNLHAFLFEAGTGLLCDSSLPELMLCGSHPRTCCEAHIWCIKIETLFQVL